MIASHQLLMKILSYLRRSLCPLLTVLGLSGCAGGPVEPVAPLGRVQLSDGWLIGADRTERLAWDEWLPASPPRLLVIAVHGFGDHGRSSFGDSAREWAEHGIATLSYDQRGFGRNPSFRRWPGAETLVADLAAVVDFAEARYPGVPLALMGHSMGGAVVTAFLGDPAYRAQAAKIEHAVLLAPALWGGDGLNPFYRMAAWSAALLVPDRRFTGEGLVRIQASDNLPMLRALSRDPHYLGPPSAREILGLVRLMDHAGQVIPQLRTPVLVVYGAKDQLIPRQPLRRSFDMIPAQKEWWDEPEGWHMLLRDLIGPQLRARVAAHLLASVPKTR